MTYNNSLIVIALLLSSVLLVTQNSAFAEIIPAAPPEPTVFFTTVHVDTNPLPNKPFTVYADIQSQSTDWSTLLIYITAPKGVSVVSPLVSNLGFVSQGNTVRASWTLIASNTGSYPLIITAHSNFPADTETFAVTVNIGSPQSLVLSGITVPGNIYPNDNFTVGIKLKNAAIVPDSNVLAQISVPAGLQLLDNVTQYTSSMDPNQEINLKWRLKAETAGSFVVSFNYTSTNAGSNSVLSDVNVGIRPVVSGALLSITTHSTSMKENSINPLVLDITNNDVQDVHNLQIVSASGEGYVSTNTPAWIGDLAMGAKKTTTLQISTSNNTFPLQIPVLVKYDSDGNSFTETYQTALQLENQPDFKIETVTATPPLSYAGDTADRIDVQIFNAGMGADDVYTTLNLPQAISPAWGGANTAYFGRIDTFQTMTASFFVNIDSKTSSGNYPLTMLVTNGEQKTNLNVNFVVAQKALFNFISIDDSQLYSGAANVPLKVSLRNDGTSSAQTITTKLLSGNSVPGVKSDTLTTIGNIENIGTVLPGQVFTTTFLVNLDPTVTSGDQVATVEIDWTQNGKDSFVQTVTVPYHVSSGPPYLLYYDGVPLAYLILAGMMVVGIALFAKQRQKRMKMIEHASLQRTMDHALDFPGLEMVQDVSATKNNRWSRDTRKEITADNAKSPEKSPKYIQ